MNTIEEGKSRLYQPERVSFSSKDDISSLTNDGIIGFYDNFRIQLKVPILGVKHLELIRASVPCIYPTIPDTELVFWYYRLPKQVGYDEPVPPSAEYLHCIRIQPSFVPKELIYDGDQYPVNRVYNGYDDLLVDLNKACLADVNNPYFIEGDISFLFNSELNKFEFVGNNVYPASDWNPTTDYVEGDMINFNGQKYVAKYGNINISPDDTTIAYNVHTDQDEPIGSIYWSLTTSPSYFYSYAGYNDPNVEAAKLILYNSTMNNFGIIGLKGQPYFFGRDLNLRLGYTWSGEILSQNDYRNHIRPVPHYLRGNPILFDVSKYVAESYCDLVHTANLHVYCNLIGGSGYDSSGRPDLLNVIALQTGVLGVASYQNSIDTHLHKVPKEIYEVQFYLRTDTGDRFILPDSAIVNFEIKFSYN